MWAPGGMLRGGGRQQWGNCGGPGGGAGYRMMFGPEVSVVGNGKLPSELRVVYGGKGGGSHNLENR